MLRYKAFECSDLSFRRFGIGTGARDPTLDFGALVFGVGWGLGGFCPGPALAGLASGNPSVLLFVAAMLAGQWIAGRLANR